MISPLSERILAHVSGLPSPQRQMHQIMVLQAYIDDSFSADEVLIFAGYVASVEKWLAFTDEWKRRLDSARWPSFKMSEIASGGDERMEVAGWFYRAIEDHVQAMVAVAVDVQGLRRAVNELKMPSVFEDPYAIIYRAVLDVTTQYQRKVGLDEPINFIFDIDKRAAKVLAGFDIMSKAADEDIRSMLGQRPRFEDDEKFLPLQAADLLAWHVLQHWRKHRAIVGPPLRMSWPARVDILGFRVDLDYESMKENFNEMLKRQRELKNHNAGRITVTFTGIGGRKI